MIQLTGMSGDIYINPHDVLRMETEQNGNTMIILEVNVGGGRTEHWLEVRETAEEVYKLITKESKDVI